MSRALLVDDDKNLLHVAQQFLKREGPNLGVITAISAQEALQRLAEEESEKQFLP
jgi:CheY-like chemotaxis protein